MSLADVLRSHRVVVTVGSGGVGKTTTAAAMAVHAAMEGRKVLCLTIDPARRLANSLGLDEMRTSEQAVPLSLFESHGLECKGALSAMMLDTKRTFDALVAKHASDDEARDRILNNQIYQYVASSLAGTQEYMAMEKLHEVRKDPKWDLVVLDTPPTSNALDFLAAPERLIDAIDSPAMRWFLQVFDRAAQGHRQDHGSGVSRTGRRVRRRDQRPIWRLQRAGGAGLRRASEPRGRVRVGDQPRPSRHRRSPVFQRQTPGCRNEP
ncbi:MAG: AAA family ATPase [Deltaproteobacteria bacterium]|nr:AAA family ATPase [Deltaproteobacteria bacterium]